MNVAGIGIAEFARRRRQLMRMAGADAILVVPAAPVRVRSNDTHHPYRQDSDFWYLSGFGEPEAVLVLVPGRAAGEALLFCRERDREREAWDGARLGPEDAVDVLGLDDAYPIGDMDEILPHLIEGRNRVYHHFGRDADFDLTLIGWVKRARAASRAGAAAPHEFQELGHLLHDLRVFKSPSERRLMAEAARVAALAHVDAMRAVRPGMHEYEVEAELVYRFRRHDAVPSYEPIVASGANACILHYRSNRARMLDGDLLLIDAGAEVQGYASDISRSFPVNGRFSTPQRTLYELVLAANRAACAAVRPGVSWNAPHEAAVEVLAEGLLRLGLLKGSLRQCLREQSYRRFYMHRTGHWLGLDVHDVGDYRVGEAFRQLEPDMAFTIEPGLYIAPDAPGVAAKWRGIGIRIEDDVIVTRQGVKLLSDGVPRDPDAIEALMAGVG